MSLRLVVLSRSRRIPSTKRLVEAARARGHVVRVLAPSDVDVHLDGAVSRLVHHRKKIRLPDVVVPRIAASIASYGLPILEQFGMHGAALMNSARAIGQSRNPARCLQLLAGHGLDIPATVMSRNIESLKSMLDVLGGVPVLVKLLQGSERRGLMVCESEQSLEAALEAVLGLGHNIVLQEYVRRASRDVRVFVVGGHAIASVARTVRPARLTRTLSGSGRLEACTMSDEVRHAAETAAKVCELDVCAVDLLEVKHGAKIFEINASPALPDMEAASGVDLATPIIKHAEVLAARRTVKPPSP